jgi:hypothetical protein
MKKISLREATPDIIGEITERVLGKSRSFAIDTHQAPGMTTLYYSLSLPEDLSPEMQKDLHNALRKRFAFPIRRSFYNSASYTMPQP